MSIVAITNQWKRLLHCYVWSELNNEQSVIFTKQEILWDKVMQNFFEASRLCQTSYFPYQPKWQHRNTCMCLGVIGSLAPCPWLEASGDWLSGWYNDQHSVHFVVLVACAVYTLQSSSPTARLTMLRQYFFLIPLTFYNCVNIWENVDSDCNSNCIRLP